MAVNPYFQNLSYTPTQDLMEDLLIESIKMFGMDITYIPRTLVSVDKLLGESAIDEFTSGVVIEMYMNNVEGFDGGGDLLSKFGVEIRDQVTFWVSRRRFVEEFASTELQSHQDDPTKAVTVVHPREGDLLYMPMNGNIFQIMFVEDEKLFYPQGKLMVFELRCELFEKSSEKFNTGIAAIDTIDTIYPVSNVTTSEPDDCPTFDAEKDVLLDFSEFNPFGEV